MNCAFMFVLFYFCFAVFVVQKKKYNSTLKATCKWMQPV